MKQVIVFLLTGYRMLSKYTPSNCRFHPSCSSYALEAVTKYGAFKGLYLTLLRLLRCHPYHKGGYDPVP